MVRFMHWRSLASLVLQLAILGVLIAAFFIRFWQVSGLSMSPHITSGEFVLINTLAYRFARRHAVISSPSGTTTQRPNSTSSA